MFVVSENVTEGLQRIDLSKTRAYELYKAFISGRDVMEELPYSARPLTFVTEVNIANMCISLKEIVPDNPHSNLSLSVSHKGPEFSPKT